MNSDFTNEGDTILKLLKKLYDGADGITREKRGELAGAAGLVCNLVLCAAKFAAGFLSGSLSIIADAANNLADSCASVMTLIGFKVSRRPADREHPFGHARMDNIAGGLIAMFIILMGSELFKTSIIKIINPVPVDYSALSFAVLAVSVAVKLLMMRLYKRVSKQIGSAALEAAAGDSRNDVLTTLAVLLGAAAQHYLSINADGWLGAAVAAFMLVSGFSILIRTLSPLLGEGPSKQLVDDLYRYITGFEGVLGLHDLMVHSYGPSSQFATVHVEMSAADDPLHSHGVIDNIERGAAERFGINLVVHLDPVASGDAETESISRIVSDAAKSIDPRLSVHDIRIVKTHDHKKIIFDLAVPADFAAPSDLAERLTEAICRSDAALYPVFHIDRNYNAPSPQN